MKHKAYVSPAMPQFSTNSFIAATITTQFFAPWMSFDEAAKHVIEVPIKENHAKRRKKVRTKAGRRHKRKKVSGVR